jgi:hypothetical protein
MNFRILRGLTIVLMTIGSPIGDLHAKDDDEKDHIEKLMEKLHEGKKSPYRQLLTAAEKPAADWDALGKNATPFVPLAKLLKQAKNAEIRDSADGYADAVNNLGKAIAAKDWAQARKAITGLKNSCADCHFKGGVGGKLED